MLVVVPWPAADWIELNGRLTLLVCGRIAAGRNCSAERPMLTALAVPSLPTILIWPSEVMVTPGGRPETESTGIGLFGSLPGGAGCRASLAEIRQVLESRGVGDGEVLRGQRVAALASRELQACPSWERRCCRCRS